MEDNGDISELREGVTKAGCQHCIQNQPDEFRTAVASVGNVLSLAEVVCQFRKMGILAVFDLFRTIAEDFGRTFWPRRAYELSLVFPSSHIRGTADWKRVALAASYFRAVGRRFEVEAQFPIAVLFLRNRYDFWLRHMHSRERRMEEKRIDRDTSTVLQVQRQWGFVVTRAMSKETRHAPRAGSVATVASGAVLSRIRHF